MCSRVPLERCACVLVVLAVVLGCSGFRIDNVTMTDVSKRNGAEAPLRPRVRHQRLRPCAEPDVSWKAYRAPIVVHAKVESRSARCKFNCTVFYKVLEPLKNSSYQIDERIMVRFGGGGGGGGGRGAAPRCDGADDAKLTRIKAEQSKEYILFLDTDGPHDYNPVFVPQIRKNKTLPAVRKVLAHNFKPKNVSVHLEAQPTKFSNKRLKLVCKVRGFPIPIIYWKLNNNTLLQQDTRYRITHKNDGKDRKKSTLVIRNYAETDSNSYQCVARGVDGNETSQSFQTNKIGKPCPEDINKDWCFNGGRCFPIESMGEYGCECADGFSGVRCQIKSSDQSIHSGH